MNIPQGTGVALITPFLSDGTIDTSGLKNLVNHTIKCGVEFLVLMGTTAESATLSAQEKQQVTDLIIQENAGRLPMVIGIGGNNTAQVVAQIQQTDLSPYAAILSVAPAYNKPTQQGIYEHFAAIAQATKHDIILYNVPSRTASNIAPETTLRLANDFKNIVAIKEASPDYHQSSTLLKNKPTDFHVYSGDDEYALPMTLAGGAGVISVIGQAIPQYSQLIRYALKHNVAQSYELQYSLLDLIRLIYKEGNPAGIKALLEAQKICQRHTRLPLVQATETLANQIEKLYQKLP